MCVCVFVTHCTPTLGLIQSLTRWLSQVILWLKYGHLIVSGDGKFMTSIEPLTLSLEFDLWISGNLALSLVAGGGMVNCIPQSYELSCNWYVMFVTTLRLL